ncbi:MAG: thioredoxin, partial [Chitinophagaceae bacterium]
MKFNLSILVLIFLLSIPFTPEAQQPLPPAEFQKAIAHPDVQVLDVRTAAEYGTGHLDSVFLADWNARPDFIRRVSSLNKSKPLYVYCLSGVRSAQAAEWLQKEGFNTYTLAGGINAWKKQGLPLANEVMVPQVSFADFKKSLPSKGTVLVDVGADWCPPCHQ